MKMEERERLVKKEAIERGLREGRIQGRIQGERIGEERLASLLMNLSKQNRQEDSIKALENLEYRKVGHGIMPNASVLCFLQV